jgi:hypothetical protein
MLSEHRKGRDFNRINNIEFLNVSTYSGWIFVRLPKIDVAEEAVSNSLNIALLDMILTLLYVILIENYLQVTSAYSSDKV